MVRTGCGAQRLRLRLHHALGVGLDLPRRVRPKLCDKLIVRAVDVALHAPRVIVRARSPASVRRRTTSTTRSGRRMATPRTRAPPGPSSPCASPRRTRDQTTGLHANSVTQSGLPPVRPCHLELVQQPRAPVAPFDARPVLDVAVAGRRLEVEVVAAEVELAAGGAVERGAVALPLLPPPGLRRARRDDLEAVVRRDRLDVRPQLRRVRSVDVRLRVNSGSLNVSR